MGGKFYWGNFRQKYVREIIIEAKSSKEKFDPSNVTCMSNNADSVHLKKTARCHQSNLVVYIKLCEARPFYFAGKLWI